MNVHRALARVSLAVSILAAASTLSGDEGFKPLFDGKSLDGWSGKKGLWSVRDGAIVGSSLPAGIQANTFLVSDKSYKNFILRLRFKYSGGNSGIQFRSQQVDRPEDFVIAGYQADIGEGYHGSIYDEKRRGMLAQSRLDWVLRFIKKDDWNLYEVRAIGADVELKINELVTARYRETDAAIPREGRIALQLHAGQAMEIQFKDIEIREILPKRVLFTTHAAGFAHSSRAIARDVVAALGRDSGWFEAVVTDGVEAISPDGLKGFDAVGFYTTGDLDKFPLSKEHREHLIAWVKSGRAFFGVHSATDTYKDWQPYWEMLGGSFAGHPWNAGDPAVTIDVEDPSHPSAQHLDSQWTIQDEIYQFTNYSRARLHVILSLNPKEHQKGSTPHRDYPVAWCRDFEKGKVFYTSLGHREDVWTNPVYQRHLLGGLLWSLGVEGYQGSAAPGRPKAKNDWVALFDGKTTSGWKGVGNGAWEVLEGGILKGSGKQGHLFSPQEYRNFHYKAEALVTDGSNSGMYFRALMEPGVDWPRGMEAQVNSSHADPARTGTLYGYERVYEQLVPPGQWFTQEVIAVDDFIVLKVNGRVVVKRQVPYDNQKHFPKGRFAFQQHHEGSEAQFRNVQVRELPGD
jgi:type 1 glutamine amidotransferase